MTQLVLLQILSSCCLVWTFAAAATPCRVGPPVTFPLNMDTDWRQWTPSELEKEVSPSRWNPCKNPTQVIDDFMKISVEDTKIARQSIPNKLNISYGSLPSQMFDLYGTDLPEDAPILFFIHGGYWQEGGKDYSGGFAPLQHKNGFKTVAFGYTLAPTAKIGDMEQELVLALKVLIKMSPKAKIILAGHSAGGQLAASLLHSPSLPTEIANQLSGLILISGVYDLEPLVPTYVNEALKMDEKEARSLSALFKPFNNVVHFETLKTLVLVGGHDSPEFQRQSADYFDKLKGRAKLDNTKFFKSESDDHFTIVENLADETSDCYKSVHEFLNSVHASTPTPSGIGFSLAATKLPITLLCLSLLVCPIIMN